MVMLQHKIARVELINNKIKGNRAEFVGGGGGVGQTMLWSWGMEVETWVWILQTQNYQTRVWVTAFILIITNRVCPKKIVKYRMYKRNHILTIILQNTRIYDNFSILFNYLNFGLLSKIAKFLDSYLKTVIFFKHFCKMTKFINFKLKFVRLSIKFVKKHNIKINKHLIKINKHKKYNI